MWRGVTINYTIKVLSGGIDAWRALIKTALSQDSRRALVTQFSRRSCFRPASGRGGRGGHSRRPEIYASCKFERQYDVVRARMRRASVSALYTRACVYVCVFVYARALYVHTFRVIVPSRRS